MPCGVGQLTTWSAAYNPVRRSDVFGITRPVRGDLKQSMLVCKLQRNMAVIYALCYTTALALMYLAS
jgi:hypothetical protein